MEKNIKREEERMWFKNTWRRILVDMHIPDWSPEFLSKLDPKKYVEMMEAGGTREVMLYANSHVGLCFYPTKTGQMHAGLQNRDFFGEVTELCHKRGLKVVTYYTLIFNNWAYINHPDWRIRPEGKLLTGTRYGVCCPNSPYQQFALAQTAEVCGGYNCEGIFFDMTFWPGVCYCPHCISRYRKETGLEPPIVIDWNNPEWVRFQRMREKWLDEFAAAMTKKVRSVNPKMTVTHQFSPVIADWHFGVPFSLADHCDYLSGDFYGETIQQSFVCKIFHSLSRNKPFEFHTSRCLDLTDHVTLKTPERLRTQAFLAPAHGSAFMFIDAIEPDGKLNAGVYQRIRSVFDEMAPYEPYLGGELCADVAVYFSQESKFDPAENGINLTNVPNRSPAEPVNPAKPVPHIKAALGACLSLRQNHIPFTVITRRNLTELKNYQVVVLPEVFSLNKKETESFRDFVSAGGSLYASYRTATKNADGTTPSDFLLADIFGASTDMEESPELTFFTPKTKLLKELISPQEHMIHPRGQLLIKTRSAEVLATLTLPYVDPKKSDIFGKNFASIHSNPPGSAGNKPAIVLNQFGKGLVCYAAGAIEAVDYDLNRSVFAGLVRRLTKHPTWFEADTHKNVEVTLLHQPEKKRFILSLLKSEPELVNTRIDAQIRIRIPGGAAPTRMMELPEKKTVPYRIKDGFAEAKLSDIKTLTMLSFEYKELT